ncbi:hypothetical protein L0F63_001519 [Massospora cicadina]|nr:hypothetical protein L0F63_001519 [Massospora cicadina]
MFTDSPFQSSSFSQVYPASAPTQHTLPNPPEAYGSSSVPPTSPTPASIAGGNLSESTPQKIDHSVNPLAFSRNHASPRRHAGFRHTMYISKARTPTEKGVLKDIEKLRLDSPRNSFESDSDIDYHSWADYTFSTDDLNDFSSIATSEVRRSTDSLTPSEVELIKAEYQAELTLEEALNVGDEATLISERQFSSRRFDPIPNVSLPPLTGTSSKISTSSNDSAPPSTPSTSPHFQSNPPAIKPIPPKDEDDPKQYLDYLVGTFGRDEIGSLISKKDGFHLRVLEAFMDSLNFRDVPIDMALRKLVSVLVLPKEGQQIDRILTVFSKRYFETNVGLFNSEDAVYSLAFSLLLLHTDAHNKLVKNKMNKDEYIRQTRQLDDASHLPVAVLEILYDNITAVEFFRSDEPSQLSGLVPPRSWYQKLQEGGWGSGSKPGPLGSHKTSSAVKVSTLFGSFRPERSPFTYRSAQNGFLGSLLKSPFKMWVRGLQPFYQSSTKSRPTSGFSITFIDEAADISELRCLKEGLLLRKSDVNGSGRKAHLRAWREYWVVLAGSQLVLFKENKDTFPAPRPYSVTSVANVIAVLDLEYKRHPHAFRFVTSDGRQYLFRADSDRDMLEWVAMINFAAAYKSVDLLPRGVTPHEATAKPAALPSVKFDFEEDAEEQLRRAVILTKLSQLDRQLQASQARLDDLLQLCNQLRVMVTLTRATRDHLRLVIENLKSRTRQAHIDQQRIQCYREILHQDLAFSQ